MSLIKCCYKNILETGTVTLAAGAENPAYPLYRLYDRDIGKIFRAAAAVTLEVKVDQAGSQIPIDRLFIPAGHNLDGMTLDILYSNDGAAWSPAVAQWVQSGAGQIEKYWASENRLYWKFKITSPGAVPEFAELFLGPTYEWEKPASRPTGAFDDQFNVENIETSAGGDRFIVHGDPKRQRSYHVPRASEAMKTSILALNTVWAGSKPFWLCDLDGVWIYGKLRAPIGIREVAYQRYAFDFDFIEVLPE